MPPYLLQTQKLSHAPQHNPYDKFTQGEFDAWIGGITSALKQALGQEDEVVSPPAINSHHLEQSNSSDEEEVERLVEFAGESSDEEEEASLSYSTARRVSKGKARDPRDGPGFGGGDQSKPIVIGSDSEEEEEPEVEEEGDDDEGDEVTEEWDSPSEEDVENPDLDWAEAESSVQARIRREKLVFTEVTEDDDGEFEEDEDKDEFEGDERQGDDDEEDNEVPSLRQMSSPVLVVDSDEEDELRGTTSPRHVLDEAESTGESLDEDDIALPLSTSIRIGPPRYRAKHQRRASPAEENDIDVSYKDIQPLENNTSFPPPEIVPSANDGGSIELPDPWAGPETYAEDYCSGGDVRKSPHLTADSLGMELEELHEPQQTPVLAEPPLEQQRLAEQHNEAPEVQDVILLDVDDVDEAQPLSEDTSFPPNIVEDNHFQSPRPIEIPDPWVGLKTYAQDFYYGGDVRPLQNGILNPHRLGYYDESAISTPTPQHEVLQSQDVNRVNEADRSEEQSPSKVDAANDSNIVYESPQFNYTVEVSERWDEPIAYEEDFSGEVEVKSFLQMVANRSGASNDGGTPIIIDVENETVPVRPQEVITGTSDDGVKSPQEHLENPQESAEQVSNYVESLAPSRPKDLTEPSAPVQVEDFSVLYDDIAVTGVPQHSVHDKNRDDVPAFEWIDDSTFLHDITATTITATSQAKFDASTSEQIQADFIEEIEETSEETAENADEGISISAPETILPTAEVSVEQTIDEVYDDDHSEVGLQKTSEVSEMGSFPLPLASPGSTKVIEDAHSIDHDQEPEIRSLTTLALDGIGTDGPEVSIEFAPKDVPVAPEIEEAVKETDDKVEIGSDEIPLDSDAVPGVLHKSSTKDTTEEFIEVLDEDSTTFVDVASKKSDHESNEPIDTTAKSDESGLTLAQPDFTVTPSMTQELQSISGDVDISPSVDSVHTSESDSQTVPASQDNPSDALTDVTVHTSSTSTSQPQPLDPTVNSRRSPSVIEPLHDPAASPAILPPAPDIFEIETTAKEKPRPDLLIAQGPIPVNPDTSAPLTRQNVQLPSSSFPSPTLLPYPRPPWVGPYSMDVVMHKASEPILFADPYPASLSTPDDTHRVDMSYEQFFHQNSLSSTSDVPNTAGKNVGNGQTQNQNQIPVADDPARETYVQSHDEAPLLQEDDLTKVESVNDVDLTFAKPVAATLSSSPTLRGSVADNTTRDIHGQSHNEALLLQQETESANDVDITKPVVTALSSSAPSQDLDKSLKLNILLHPLSMVSESTVQGDENAAQQSSPLSSPVVEYANGASTTRVRSPFLVDDLPSILIIKKVYADDQTPDKPKAGRSQKRKRSSSVTMSSPLPKTGSSKKSEKNKAASRLPAKPRGSHRKSSKLEKGKGKELSGPPAYQGSFDTQSISSRSSSDASAARRMLEPSSRGTSRASSIVSTAPSDNYINAAQPSPTSGKGSFYRQQPLPLPPPPVPLLHRHHHNRPQPSRPVLTQRASLSGRQPDPATAEPLNSKQSSSSLHRHSSYSTSSPVTRSNCRYHKISIPLDDDSDEEGSGDEDVKLVYFLVPGCSLGNQELNRDEKIVDHGDAQPSDGLLMTSDLDAYAFNAPLLSVLRLLVGVDMLREGEIYYLPLPGSDWVPRKSRDTSNKAHPSSADHSPIHTAPRRNSNISTSTVVNPSVSSNGSPSILAPFRSMKPSSTISQTSSELTEVEASPQSKRIKPSAVEEEGSVSEMMAEFESHPRKSKHLDQDAEEYRPETGKQGLKRSRTSDMIRELDGEDQKLKKQRTEQDLRST